MKLLVFSLFAALAPGSAWADTTVLIVRHAEKQVIAGNEDPPLTPAGTARAEALAQALASVSLDHVYTTPYLRNRSTAEPTAKAHQRPAEVVEAKDVAGLSQRLQRLVDQTVLVVGHSNTVPELLAKLGVKDPPKLEDGDYDNLFVVTLAKGKPARLLRLHYGAKAP